ncbi:MAG: hypothetical protein MN733_32470, partial [Nitrososphaera sp.]|nr:hypothetical protein [Nitrososphaera sp.]
LSRITGEFARVTRAAGYLLITDFHPGAVAAGWRTEFAQPEGGYKLPNMGHTRNDYLEALEAAGFVLLDVIDLYVRDIPDHYQPFYEGWIREHGDHLLGLIVFAQKGATTARS